MRKTVAALLTLLLLLGFAAPAMAAVTVPGWVDDRYPPATFTSTGGLIEHGIAASDWQGDPYVFTSSQGGASIIPGVNNSWHVHTSLDVKASFLNPGAQKIQAIFYLFSVADNSSGLAVTFVNKEAHDAANLAGIVVADPFVGGSGDGSGWYWFNESNGNWNFMAEATSGVIDIDIYCNDGNIEYYIKGQKTYEEHLSLFKSNLNKIVLNCRNFGQDYTVYWGTPTVTQVTPASAQPAITTSTLPGGTVSTAYNQAVTATSSDPLLPIIWSVSSGSLPDGLSLNSSTGAITGTPTKAGTFSFTVKAENLMGSDTKPLSIVIAEPPPAPTTPTGSRSSNWDPSRLLALNGLNGGGTTTNPATANDAVPYAAPTIDGIGIGKTTAKKIPVYEKESTKSKKLFTITSVDSEVKILGISKGFAYVEVDGVKGYIQLSRLNIGFTARPAYITKAKTKAYSESGMKKTQLITTIAKNEEVGVLTFLKSSKALVEYDGQELWVSFGNLKLAPLE